MAEPELLIDASRLIWRVWSGRLPTGIDKVCLAYLDHFGSRARAVVQRGDWRLALSKRDSQKLFGMLRQGGPDFRRRLIAAAPGALLRADRPRPGQVYLNVGHTGLNAPGLADWVQRTGVRPIYLIHDLIPITHPEFCRAGEAARHEKRMTNALVSAAGIIANSQATLDDLSRFAMDKRLAMPPSIVSWLAGHDFGAGVQPTALGRPYFITVGTIEGRKNHHLLLRIWQRLIARLGDAAPVLVIVGQRGWSAQDVFDMLDNKPNFRDHVRELGTCSDAELGSLIAGARALLMPSKAEGFGLPVVEALQLGTPVITADLAVYREIAGDLPSYISADAEADWESAILAFMVDCEERQEKLTAVRGYRAPTWREHFVPIEAWLDEIGS
jgi:glycosyltransferase involved in cell wall biosynthesis